MLTPLHIFIFYMQNWWRRAECGLPNTSDSTKYSVIIVQNHRNFLFFEKKELKIHWEYSMISDGEANECPAARPFCAARRHSERSEESVPHRFRPVGNPVFTAASAVNIKNFLEETKNAEP